MTLVMPAMVPAQAAGWLALIEIGERMPDGWALIGGQLVHLHCVERGESPPRPTTDFDTVLDVRAYPTVLHDFTKVLVDIGFDSAGESPDGHQYRWLRGDAQIDVLIPRHLGERAEKRKGVTGGTTVGPPPHNRLSTEPSESRSRSPAPLERFVAQLF